jgi:hypothetical protein
MNLLVIGEKNIKEARTCVSWEEVVKEIPTLGDYDNVVISMETLHIEQLGRFSTAAFARKMIEAVNSNTRIYCLTAPKITSSNQSNYSIFPFNITAIAENGKSFQETIENDYFKKVKSWTYYLRYLIDYQNWKYHPFLHTRHNHPVALQVQATSYNANGFVYFFPPQELPEGESSFKNLFKFIFSDKTKDPKLPDFIEKIVLANENELAEQIAEDTSTIQTLSENIKENNKKIEEINSKKGILAFKGRPLERSVKKVCRGLGLAIGGIEVFEEDGMLELDGNSIPVEIKGHNNGIVLNDVRQIMSRGKKAKTKPEVPVQGILICNPYAETPLEKRGADFEHNIIKAAEPWFICLISTRVLFEYLKDFLTFGKSLLPEKILTTVGVLEFESVNSKKINVNDELQTNQ